MMVNHTHFWTEEMRSMYSGEAREGKGLASACECEKRCSQTKSGVGGTRGDPSSVLPLASSFFVLSTSFFFFSVGFSFPAAFSFARDQQNYRRLLPSAVRARVSRAASPFLSSRTGNSRSLYFNMCHKVHCLRPRFSVSACLCVVYVCVVSCKVSCKLRVCRMSGFVVLCGYLVPACC